MALVLFAAPPVGMADDVTSATSPPVPAASLTVSGGVSLGAYEAGFLHYALATAQRGRMMDLRLVTGASAGSLNAFLAVLAACGTGPGRPGDSLAWATWIPTGFDQLFRPSATSALGAFSREWLERSAGPVEEAWAHGLDERCDVVLGVSTTRVKPRVVRASGLTLALPSIEEKFAVRIQGRGPGLPPRATNYVDPRSAGAPLLVTDERGEIAFSALRDLVVASMSFPVLFPPQPLRTCVTGVAGAAGSSGATAPGARDAATTMCRSGDAEDGLYVDGGVLDNTPLRLAVRLARDGLRTNTDGRLAWQEVPTRGPGSSPPAMVFGFVDPEATAYPPPLVSEEPSIDSMSELVRAITIGFVEAARAKELVTLVEENPEIALRVLVPRRHFPAASAPLFALLGFFETEFRVFDFYLGMYDARRMFEGAFARGGPPDGAPYPEAEDAPRTAPVGGWAPFHCLRAIYDEVGAPAEACAQPELRGLRILAQVALEKLYSTCSAAPRDDERLRWTEHCSRAAGGAAPPRVPGVPTSTEGAQGWRRLEGESELAYTMRLLGAHGYEFRDLDVAPGRSDLALRKIRRSLGRAADALGSAQPTASGRFTVGRAAKLVADLVTYFPPQRVVYVSTGPTETEVGFTTWFPDWDWVPEGLRLTGVLGLRGLGDLLSSGRANTFAFLPTVGIGVDPLLGSSMWTQLHVGARAGWLFAAADGYGTGSCVDGGASHITACSRPVVQAFVGFTMFERFRLQLVGEWFPAIADRVTAWSVAPGLGLEFGF